MTNDCARTMTPKPLFYTFLLILLSLTVCAQVNTGDQILGLWQTETKDSHIEIFKVNNKYYGKLAGGPKIFEADGVTSKKDKKNPDPAQKERLLKNLLILMHFIYDDGIWQDGKIYDPESGNTYQCKMKLNKGILEIRGFIGISLIGRTARWTRVAR